jgi:uncharacterized protein
MIPYDPEFDPKKNAANIAKHGISLTEGDGVLMDPLAMTIEDASALGEMRRVTIGTSSRGTLLVVIWTQRGENVRLISARKAEPKERRQYESGV